MSSNLTLTDEMLNDCKVQQIMTCRNDDVILHKPESASHYSILTFFLKNLISCKCHCIHTNIAENFERVTKIENIKTDSTKILRPTHFFLNMLLSLT
jgi:hypothetical protein